MHANLDQTVSTRELSKTFQHEQKKIYKTLKLEAKTWLGETPPAIRKYEREYLLEINHFKKKYSSRRARFAKLSKDGLIRELKKADVVFLADFHTFSQSQRNGLRLLRALVTDKFDASRWMIGLELIPSRYQKTIDRYLSRKISLASLHDEIHYQEEWGFPWQNYAPIFEWALYNQIPIIALNRPRELNPVDADRDARELERRDEWTAGVLTDQITAHHRKIFVLYGELHVSRNHLPKRLEQIAKPFLKRKIRSVSIHQDLDWIYWKLAESGSDLSTQAVKLSHDSFSLVSSPPWMKLQSLVNWAEKGTDLEDAADPSDEGTESIDWLSKLKFHIETICFFLDIPAPKSDSLTLKVIDDPFKIMGQAKKLFSRAELALIARHRSANQKLFIPSLQTAYAASPSENRLAELASDYIFWLKSEVFSIFENNENDFYRLVLQSAFGFFGSLAFNPRRKCDWVEDHRKRVGFLEKNPTYRLYREETEARKLAIRFFQIPVGTNTPPSFRTYSPFSQMMAAKYIGQILGSGVYRAVMTEKVSRDQMKTLFLKNPPAQSNSFYRKRYQSLMSLLEASRPRSTEVSKNASF